MVLVISVYEFGLCLAINLDNPLLFYLIDATLIVFSNFDLFACEIFLVNFFNIHER